MASSWEKMFENQLRIQKQFERLLPNMRYLESIKKNYALWDSIAKPHLDLVNRLNSFNHIIDSPSILQIEKMTASITNILPDYSGMFLVSSSILEAYKHSVFIIPDYLNEFTKANERLLNSTNMFSSELETLKNIDFQSPIIFDNLPELLISPVVSGTAHFQTLKDLNFYDIELSKDSEEEYSGVIEKNCSIAEEKIENANKEWIVLLQGAEISLSSRNPDKVRHTITSLRELMTQILHHFAPDADIQKMYSDQKYYHNGRPTRRTRIEYILTQKYGNTSLAKIIDKDITACLELFNLYQEGTHKIVSTLGDDELLFILKRTKLLIEQLI